MASIADELSVLRGQWNVVERAVAITGNDVQAVLCTANPLRFALILPVIAYNAGGTGELIFLTTLQGNTAAPLNYTIEGVSLQVLSYRDVGALVQIPWYAWMSVAGGSFPYICDVVEVLSVSGEF